jgi:hypothetical protein
MTINPVFSRLGWWNSNGDSPATDTTEFRNLLFTLNRAVYILHNNGQYAVASSGHALMGSKNGSQNAWPIIGYAPASPLKNLGDASFLDDYGLAYPYIAGAMAHAITSAEMVEEMGKTGCWDFSVLPACCWPLCTRFYCCPPALRFYPSNARPILKNEKNRRPWTEPSCSFRAFPLGIPGKWLLGP